MPVMVVGMMVILWVTHGRDAGADQGDCQKCYCCDGFFHKVKLSPFKNNKNPVKPAGNFHKL